MGNFFCSGGGIGTIKQMIKDGHLQTEIEVSFAIKLTEVLKYLCLILIIGHSKFDKGCHRKIEQNWSYHSKNHSQSCGLF